MLRVGSEPVYTPPEAASRAGVTRRHIYRLAQTGKIATVRHQGRTYVSARSLSLWMLHGTETPEARAHARDLARSAAAIKANETRRKDQANAS